MLIPIGTDAPLYHRPIATVGLILLNCLAFIASCMLAGSVFGIGTIDQAALEPYDNGDYWQNVSWGEQIVDFLCLNYGTINPLQWLTSIFMHADPIHLLGNMIFLWTFGLIVEGKVGWWKFLAIYLAIGIVQSGVEQIVMFPFVSEGGSLGASSAIFGLMAICLVWAPRNDLQMFALIWFHPFTFELSVMGFVIFQILMEILAVAFSGLAISSALLHLMGAAPGFLIGFGLLLMREVDCEGFDLISVAKGEEGERKTITREQEREIAAEAEQQRQRQAQEYEQGMQWIEQYLAKGLYEGALGRFQALKRAVPGVSWKREHLYEVIRGFHTAKRYLDSVPLMEEYVARFPDDSGAMQLKLAQVFLVHAERPHKALKVAAAIPDGRLFQKQLQLKQKLMAAAQMQIDDGAIDLMD